MNAPKGAYLWDVDGNRYIDFLQAGGPTLLGSNDPVIRKKVFEILETCGPVTGLFHEYELKLAQLIHKHMPAIEMFRMLGSGTEGCMAAIRAARAFTNKKHVIKVGGAYHGWSDPMVYGMHIPGTRRLEAARFVFAYNIGTTGCNASLYRLDKWLILVVRAESLGHPKRQRRMTGNRDDGVF